METITKFEAKKIEATDILQKLKEANAKGVEIEKATTMLRFWEAMEQEAGEELGALLYEFAVLVGFDYKLLKPIGDKDAGFWSDIEGMGWLEFNLRRLGLERSARQISLLQSIDVGIKKMVEFFDIADKSMAEANDESKFKVGVTDKELEKMAGVAEEPFDIDALLKE